MRQDSYNKSDLVCLECGSVFPIMRPSNKFRKYGHIKDLWCYNCKCVTKHFEVVDVDKFMSDVQHNEGKFQHKSDDDLEVKIKKVLQRKKTDGK